MATYKVRGGGTDFKLGVTDEAESILQNAAVILSTPKGDVPLYRDFGLDSRSTDRPLQVAEVMLVADVKDAIERYEPRLEVVRVTFERDGENLGRLIPIVEVKIRDEQT